MSAFQMPGPLCRILGALEIDSGTLCLSTSPTSGPVGSTKRKKLAPFPYANTGATYRTASPFSGSLNSSARKGDKASHTVKKASSGPYIISDTSLLTSLPRKDAVIPASDSAFGIQCVGLVKYYSQAGGTSAWKKGAAVKGNAKIATGTAIATFDKKSEKYLSKSTGNHACFFIEFTSDGSGIKVLEQHVRPFPDKIQTRVIKFRGDEEKINPSDNADDYSVIL